MTPYMVGKLAPNPTHSTRGLVKYVPGRCYFRAVPSQNRVKFVTSSSPLNPLTDPTPSSPHCALKVSERYSLWQPPAAHSDERPHPQKSSRAQCCLNALAPGYLRVTDVRGHPIVWSLTLRPGNANQDPVVYGTKFGVVFLAEGPPAASIQKGFDCFGLYVRVLDLPLRHRYDLAFGRFWCRRQGSTRRLLGRRIGYGGG